MLKVRVFPCLLLKETGLVKTVKFKNPTYIGDPINAVRIFNAKEVDELALLDITATAQKRKPPFDLIAKISDECRMPLTVGGGIRSLEDVRELLSLGVEKVVINTYAFENPEFIREAAEQVGSQSIVVSIDVRRRLGGKYEVFVEGGKKATGFNPVNYAKTVEQNGAGEIILNAIDRDGTMQGYDIPLTKKITEAVGIPVIACGGAGKLEDFAAVVNQGGASAVTAGSMFVFHGPRKAVLINFPSRAEIETVWRKGGGDSDGEK